MGGESAPTEGARGGPLGEAAPWDPRDLAHTRARVRSALFGARVEPQRVGRFVLLERVGAGASAVVYAAYDPRLDRKVALKILKGPRAAEGRTRWLREGQAMARLSHPNVLPVFDAGAVGDELFLAMEFVDGGTMRDWLAEEPRPPREVLRVFTAAGRGLAAAHGAGIVHRDFKPENVLIGRDGRVRVADFGLSRTTPAPRREPGQVGRLDGAVTQTRSGAIRGTPAYMAPEQLRGEPATACSDQFGFCVALWEALYGVRPFPQEDLERALEAMEAGSVALPDGGDRVPGAVRRALLRGLAADPGARFGSMEELLAALAPDRSKGMRTLVGLGAGLLALAAAGTFVATRDGSADACRAAGSRIEDVWGPQARRAVSEAFGQVPAPFAAEALPQVLATLDAYGARWRAAHDDACAASHLRHEQSGAVLDLRMACLDRRRAALAATVELLARADAEVVAHARDLVRRLPDLEGCADPGALLDAPAHPDTPAHAAVRDRIERARARWRVGKASAAVAEAAAARRAARDVDDPVLQAQAEGVLGVAQAEVGRDAAGEATVLDAVGRAEAAGADELAARLWIALTRLAADHRQDLERAQLHLARAEAAVARLRAPPADLRFGLRRARAAEARLAARYDEARAELAAAADMAGSLDLSARARLELELDRADVEGRMGLYDGAEARLTRASARAKAQLGDTHPLLAQILGARARLELARGHLEEAQSWARQARRLWQTSFGDEHPRLAHAIATQARVAYQAGEYGPAAGGYDEAIAMLERTRGADHSDLVSVLRERAMVRVRQGEFEEARRDLERARRIARDSLGADHPGVASVEEGLGTLAMREGDPDAGLRHALRALEIRERALGPDHVHLAYSHNNVGDLLVRAGRIEEGAAHLERALTIFVEHLGGDDPMTAFVLSNLGRAELQLGRLGQARAHLEDALAIRQAARVPAPALATTQFDLARVLDRQEQDAPRARQLARAAREAFAAQPELYAEILGKIDRWLRAHAAG